MEANDYRVNKDVTKMCHIHMLKKHIDREPEEDSVHIQVTRMMLPY